MDEGIPAIRLRGLTKLYGATKVLDGIDLEIRPGEILGYVGPNGAGKSTTVKIVCGLLGGYAGEAAVAGFDVRTRPLEAKRRLGYVPENALLYENLTVAETLLFVGRLHELPDALIRERAERILAELGLESRLGVRVASLSKGMRQKVLLAAALLHAPAILVLDEPLSGLDVDSALVIKEFVRVYAASGRAVLFCSHVMEVVEKLCTRIAILDGGRIVAQGSYEELERKLRGGSLEAIFASLTSAGDHVERARRVLEALS